MNKNSKWIDEHIKGKSGIELPKDASNMSGIDLELEEPFTPELIKYGVAKSHRHAVLDTYVCWLISRKWYSLEAILDEILFWNRGNKPPLHVEEIVCVVCDCWDKYRKSRRKLIPPTPTLPSRILECYHHVTEPNRVLLGFWFLEPQLGCSWRRRTVRRGRMYESIPWPFGYWWCPEYANRKAKEWAEHLIKVTRGQDLYLIEAMNKDLSHIVKAINEAEANYLWVRTTFRSAFIVDRPIEQAVHIPADQIADKIVKILTSYAPSGSDFFTVAASPRWRLIQRMDSTAKLVTESWLPAYRQLEIAFKLGAKLYSHFEWESPEKVDAGEWEKQFVREIQNCERLIDSQLSRLNDSSKGRIIAEMYALDANFGLWESILKFPNSSTGGCHEI